MLYKNLFRAIKRIIPKRSPRCTRDVCCPSKVPSRTISRHHTYIVKSSKNKPKIKTSFRI